MTPKQVRDHAERLRKEIADINLLSAASDKVGMFKLVKRLANDNAVMIRELAETVDALSKAVEANSHGKT